MEMITIYIEKQILRVFNSFYTVFSHRLDKKISKARFLALDNSDLLILK